MARNLAIEKQRREALNEDFFGTYAAHIYSLITYLSTHPTPFVDTAQEDLARLVPGLAHVRRLTKVLIVNESNRHFRQQREMCIAAARDMQALLA
ncbi:hypothetical protein BJY01DRAFT_250388 [Aspergillus pseudoustus]|uniref:Uncharacterized protein n=1 Tax=Aspergillus pseudoustus TaxID=1810923 RepID=A0ABR4JHY5_9EURO